MRALAIHSRQSIGLDVTLASIRFGDIFRSRDGIPAAKQRQASIFTGSADRSYQPPVGGMIDVIEARGAGRQGCGERVLGDGADGDLRAVLPPALLVYLRRVDP
ncbi:hypothetical protein AAJ72_09960 [Citromicrobium sp. RCC1885]|nr:hypothetical protein AAJ72_09960 [Citromicrobium sp. RCC1885]KPM26627.1 hypothetical protein AAJ74_10700 [Citromicrobium sp. RCC1878]OAM08856.1 hypothetical protein A0U43_09605 [Citromicrobium sp. RCC1897]